MTGDLPINEGGEVAGGNEFWGDESGNAGTAMSHGTQTIADELASVEAAGRFELLRALGSLCVAPDPSQETIASAVGLPGVALLEEHTDVFVLQCYPYASFYLNAQGVLGGEASDRVAGFWRALGLEPPTEPDHLAGLLGLYGSIGIDEASHDPADERRDGLLRAREALLWEHLAPWVPAFLAAVFEIGNPRFQVWASLLNEALLAETAAARPPPRLPLALRQAPEGLGQQASLPQLLDAVLSPACSGIILTRARLTAGAAELGVGLRQGERRFTIRAMFDQDGTGTLGWLAREATRWAALHRSWMPTDVGIREWWCDRAMTSAEMLESQVRS